MPVLCQSRPSYDAFLGRNKSGSRHIKLCWTTSSKVFGPQQASTAFNNAEQTSTDLNSLLRSLNRAAQASTFAPRFNDGRGEFPGNRLALHEAEQFRDTADNKIFGVCF